MKMSVISMRVYKPLLPKDLDVTRIHQNIFSFFNPGQKTRKTMDFIALAHSRYQFCK